MKHLLLLATLCLTACGGGGGGGDNPKPPPPPQRTSPYGTMFTGELVAGANTVWRSTCDLTDLKSATMTLELVGNQPGVDGGHCHLSCLWLAPSTTATQPLVLALRDTAGSWTLTLRQMMAVTYTDGVKANYDRLLTYTVAPAAGG
jgi:hypothetical protein